MEAGRDMLAGRQDLDTAKHTVHLEDGAEAAHCPVNEKFPFPLVIRGCGCRVGCSTTLNSLINQRLSTDSTPKSSSSCRLAPQPEDEPCRAYLTSWGVALAILISGGGSRSIPRWATSGDHSVLPSTPGRSCAPPYRVQIEVQRTEKCRSMPRASNYYSRSGQSCIGQLSSSHLRCDSPAQDY